MNIKLILLFIVIIVIAIYIKIFIPSDKLGVYVNNFDECVANGYMVYDNFPRKCKTDNGNIFQESNINNIEKEDLIKVYNFQSNQEINSPLHVEGEARGSWYFEASFPVKIYDDSGFLLGATTAEAQSDWMTNEFVPFKVNLKFAVPSTINGRIVFQKDNPSGLPQYDNELSATVSFGDKINVSDEKMTTYIYLSDTHYVNEPYFDCSKTTAVSREIPKTIAIARSAVDALLRGAKEDEVSKGYISNINTGVRVNKISIQDGLAEIDFDEQIEYQVAGSCRVLAIRAQITDTLKQFSSVKDVIISINGRTQDVLQP